MLLKLAAAVRAGASSDLQTEAAEATEPMVWKGCNSLFIPISGFHPSR